MESKSNEKWHLSWEGKVYGPFDFEEIISMAAKGQFDPHISYVWKPGFEGWKPCMELEVFRVMVLNPPPPPPPVQLSEPPGIPTTESESPFSKGAASTSGPAIQLEPESPEQLVEWRLEVEDLWAIRAVFNFVDSFSEGLAKVESYGKWGFIDRSGQWVVKPVFNFVDSFSEGLVAVESGGKWGFIDRSGQWVVKPVFDSAWSFSEGLVAVESDGKWGFIDRSGQWVVKPVFDSAWSFSEGLAKVESGGKWGFIMHPRLELQCKTQDSDIIPAEFRRVLELYECRDGYSFFGNLEDWQVKTIRKAFDIENETMVLAFVGVLDAVYDRGIVFTDQYACILTPKGCTRIDYGEWSAKRMDYVRILAKNTQPGSDNGFSMLEFWQLLEGILGIYMKTDTEGVRQQGKTDIREISEDGKDEVLDRVKELIEEFFPKSSKKPRKLFRWNFRVF